MTRPFIDRLSIENYGCIAGLNVQLTPLHALIGPNDSGKSTVLGALRTLSVLAAPSSSDRATQEVALLWQALMANAKTGQVSLQATAAGQSYRVQVLRGSEVYEKTFAGVEDSGSTGNTHKFDLTGGSRIVASEAELAQAVAGSQLLRLDPDALRQPTQLIPEGAPVRLMNNRGTGLPAVYDAILNRNMQAFIAINKQVAELFPTVKAISLKNPDHGRKALGVQLTDGTYVSAEFMSEGLLYFLAFAALPHVEPTAVVLIEEPENGLHPARIAEVVGVLREVSKSTQVVIATHSPLLVNELKGDEVTVVTRSAEQGVTARLLKDTPNFEERSKVYAPGELWVSYANGMDEGPLVQGGSRP